MKCEEGHSMPSREEEPGGLEVVFESPLHDSRKLSDARCCLRSPLRGVVVVA